MEHLALVFAVVGLIGIGAQWIAWRTGLPAIALMLLAGIVAGPVTGYRTGVGDTVVAFALKTGLPTAKGWSEPVFGRCGPRRCRALQEMSHENESVSRAAVVVSCVCL